MLVKIGAYWVNPDHVVAVVTVDSVWQETTRIVLPNSHLSVDVPADDVAAILNDDIAAPEVVADVTPEERDAIARSVGYRHSWHNCPYGSIPRHMIDCRIPDGER